jgi:hypothetical protein
MTRIDNSPMQSAYLLIFRGKDWDEGLSPDELQKVMDRFKAWSDGLCQSGRVVAGQALAREGKTVSGPNGRVAADGPFAESKEAIGGYLLIRATSFEEALAIARTSPGLDYGGSIEVRPILDECPVFKRARERFGLVPA